MILIRHGQSTWNAAFGPTRVDPGLPDPDLTPLGREQALSAAERLAGKGLTRVVASPYRRTLQTAELIARRLKLSITVEPLIRERFGYSCDLGTPPHALARTWPDMDFSALDRLWWGGYTEGEASVAARVRRFAKLASAWPDRDSVLAVSHWGFIKAATGETLGNGEAVRLGFESARE